MEFHHIPVLAQQCIRALDIKPDGIYADGTTGGAGHSRLIAGCLGPEGRLICIDRDADALAAARERLRGFACRIDFAQSNFMDMDAVFARLGVCAVDGILLDLGVSSYQLDTPERGFSYQNDAPLDMRMDRGQALTARDVVNTYSADRLRNIIGTYGEERYAGRIASAIVSRRQQKPIERTGELADIIRAAMPPAARREKQHPAKRTFQAIRIEVNGELTAVETALDKAVASLKSGGRLAVITFHSLEDRIVKQTFARLAQGCICPKEAPVCICGHKPSVRIVDKGGVTADAQETEQNPRARSARLRTAEKL